MRGAFAAQGLCFQVHVLSHPAPFRACPFLSRSSPRSRIRRSSLRAEAIRAATGSGRRARGVSVVPARTPTDLHRNWMHPCRSFIFFTWEHGFLGFWDPWCEMSPGHLAPMVLKFHFPVRTRLRVTVGCSTLTVQPGGKMFGQGNMWRSHDFHGERAPCV